MRTARAPAADPLDLAEVADRRGDALHEAAPGLRAAARDEEEHPGPLDVES